MLSYFLSVEDYRDAAWHTKYCDEDANPSTYRAYQVSNCDVIYGYYESANNDDYRQCKCQNDPVSYQSVVFDSGEGRYIDWVTVSAYSAPTLTALGDFITLENVPHYNGAAGRCNYCDFEFKRDPCNYQSLSITDYVTTTVDENAGYPIDITDCDGNYCT